MNNEKAHEAVSVSPAESDMPYSSQSLSPMASFEGDVTRIASGSPHK